MVYYEPVLSGVPSPVAYSIELEAAVDLWTNFQLGTFAEIFRPVRYVFCHIGSFDRLSQVITQRHLELERQAHTFQ